VFGCIFVVVVYGACFRDCRELGLCKACIIGWSSGVESIGRKGSLVTGLRRVGGEDVGRGIE
jgi:hypothetical protein